MKFQTQYRIDPWVEFDPPLMIRPDVRIRAFDGFELYLDIEVSDAEEDKFREDYLRCIATLNDEPPAEVADLLRSPEVPDTENVVFWEYVRAIRERLDRMSGLVLGCFFWRMGILGGPHELRCDLFRLRWAEVDEEPEASGFVGQQIPMPVQMLGVPTLQNLEKPFPSLPTAEPHSIVPHIPLAHSLFREAWRNHDSNPRSALVMAIAAAETAIKTLIVDLEPSTNWLIENLQSPPIDRMVREYLAILPVRHIVDDQVRRVPKQIVTAIKRAVEMRNKLVHGRRFELQPPELKGSLMAIRDLLYLCDYYGGYEWALEHVRPETIAAMRRSDSTS